MSDERPNNDKWRQVLEAERDELVKELSGIARQDPQNPDNWQAVPSEPGSADFRDEVADRLEEQDEREGLATSLEARLLEVKRALERIANGTYGVCEVGGEPISEERLEANPAARTCRRHLENGVENPDARQS